MPRIRTLKPELWLSPQVMNLSRDGRLLFIGLITQADDQGRGVADPRKLKAAIFPGDEDISAARISELGAEVEGQALAVFYDGNGHGRLYQIASWHTHQKVEKARQSAYPSPPSGSSAEPHSPDATRTNGEEAGKARGGSDPIRSDPKGSEGSDPARARANGQHSDRAPPGRARAPDAKSTIPEDSEDVQRRRREARHIADGLAAKKKP